MDEGQIKNEDEKSNLVVFVIVEHSMFFYYSYSLFYFSFFVYIFGLFQNSSTEISGVGCFEDIIIWELLNFKSILSLFFMNLNKHIVIHGLIVHFLLGTITRTELTLIVRPMDLIK